MGIKNIKERLEGSYRLIRIRRIKLGFYIIELVLALILGSAVAVLMGAAAEPFYFPVDVFLFIILIMLLVITVETIYFNGLELKYTRNKSRKYLLARNAIRKSLIIIGAAAVCVTVLFLPYSQDSIAELHSLEFNIDEVEAGDTVNNVSFDCQDELGLTRAAHIHIEVNSDENSLMLMVADAESGKNIWNADSAEVYNFSGLAEHAGLQEPIFVVVENRAATPITFSVTVTSDVSPFIRLYIPALGLAFLIVQFASISILYPIREMYSSSSIYSKNYVAPTDKGEYSVTEIKLSKKDQEEEALLDSALDVELPPPTPATPQPTAKVCEVEPEMARARGKVDDGLIEEPDIKCSNCGEMNSAQSAMCFSCGTALKAVERATVDPASYLKKGEGFANSGRFDDAISCYDEALKYDASNETALLRKGEALHKQGKWGSAVQYVNTALKINPNNVNTLVLKAKILEERDRLDKSLEIYTQILALDPDNEFAKSKMAKVGEKFVVATEEAELESAEEVLEQFMEIPGVGLARATALYEAGFLNITMLKAATEDQLAQVKGISKGVAKKIRKGLDEL